jgi:hypothetical protein
MWFLLLQLMEKALVKRVKQQVLASVNSNVFGPKNIVTK